MVKIFSHHYAFDFSYYSCTHPPPYSENLATALDTVDENMAVHKSTPFESTGGVYALSKHDVYCDGDDSFLIAWVGNTNDDSDMFSIDYICLNYPVASATCTDHYTPFSNAGTNSSLEMLQYHDVACPSQSALKGFKGIYNGDQFRIQYACCSALTYDPTPSPSAFPTIAPSFVPTFIPTQDPTVEPSKQPVAVPTFVPTQEPSKTPVAEPTYIPTLKPSMKPSQEPTFEPSMVPTLTPTALPSFEPTNSPISHPTLTPISEPNDEPKSSPTLTPISNPTYVPTSELPNDDGDDSPPGNSGQNSNGAINDGTSSSSSPGNGPSGSSGQNRANEPPSVGSTSDGGVPCIEDSPSTKPFMTAGPTLIPSASPTGTS